MGTQEGQPDDWAFQYDNALREADWIDDQPQTHTTRFRFTTFVADAFDPHNNPARHDEDSWALRVREALPFLYPPR